MEFVIDHRDTIFAVMSSGWFQILLIIVGLVLIALAAKKTDKKEGNSTLARTAGDESEGTPVIQSTQLYADSKYLAQRHNIGNEFIVNLLAVWWGDTENQGAVLNVAISMTTKLNVLLKCMGATIDLSEGIELKSLPFGSLDVRNNTSPRVVLRFQTSKVVSALSHDAVLRLIFEGKPVSNNARVFARESWVSQSFHIGAALR